MTALPHDAPAVLHMGATRSDGSRVCVSWRLATGRPFLRVAVVRPDGAEVGAITLRLSDIPGVARAFALALEHAHERADAVGAGMGGDA